MKKSILLALAILFIGLSSFKAETIIENKNENFCDILVKSWSGTLFGQTVYFNSYSCALNAGATNIQPGGMRSQCEVLTCI